MLIIALALAIVGLAAVVTAVVTSNELIAWVCIAASAIGVVLLIVDAVRERSHRDKAEPDSDSDSDDKQESEFDAEYPEDAPDDGHADEGQTDGGDNKDGEERDASSEKRAGGN